MRSTGDADHQLGVARRWHHAQRGDLTHRRAGGRGAGVGPGRDDRGNDDRQNWLHLILTFVVSVSNMSESWRLSPNSSIVKITPFCLISATRMRPSGEPACTRYCAFVWMSRKMATL